MNKRVCLGLALFAAAAAVTLQGCVLNVPPLFGVSRGPVKLETIVEPDHFWTRDQILIIDLSGVVSIDGGGGWFRSRETGMLVELKDRLDKAKGNKNIKAVILRIDSPGGGATASDLIHHEITEFKKEKDVPVVAMMQDVAASGGLYIAMAADEIYAMPTTITGSIGVIAMLPGLEGLSHKIGLEMRVIKSGKNKDLGSPWRALTEEERQIFQTMIDSMYERFLDVILAARGGKGLTRDKLIEFADGRILEGTAAHELGLIDGILYLDQVIDRVKEKAGIKDAAVISYEYPYAYRGNIYARSPRPSPRMAGTPGEVNLHIDLGLSRWMPRDARLLYLWMP